MSKSVLLILGAAAVLGILWAAGMFDEKEARMEPTATTEEHEPTTNVEEPSSTPAETDASGVAAEPVQSAEPAPAADGYDKEEGHGENSTEKTSDTPAE